MVYSDEEKLRLLREKIRGSDVVMDKLKLGTNRGQLFVRIPKSIRNLLKMQASDSIEFTAVPQSDIIQLRLIRKR